MGGVTIYNIQIIVRMYIYIYVDTAYRTQQSRQGRSRVVVGPGRNGSARGQGKEQMLKLSALCTNVLATKQRLHPNNAQTALGDTIPSDSTALVLNKKNMWSLCELQGCVFVLRLGQG